MKLFLKFLTQKHCISLEEVENNVPILKHHSVLLHNLPKKVAFYTSEPLKAFYGTPFQSVIFSIDLKKIGCVSDQQDQESTGEEKVCVSVCRYACL